MDGNPDTKRKLVTPGIGWPNGITIDYQTDYLYWADAKEKKIEKIFVGNDVGKRVVLTTRILSRPFGLTVHGDFLFWSDWRYQKIYKVNKYHTEIGGIVQSRVGIPMELAVFDKNRQVKGRHTTLNSDTLAVFVSGLLPYNNVDPVSFWRR